ncbi:MAG: hypothetical protein H7Y20_07605 [Bryobacteraceae bacterium]|nr:hypothetical protein [Bryobacteraceae bacterium]
MNKQSLVAAVIAVVAVAAVVGGILFTSHSNRLTLNGQVLKVRSHQIDSEHTLVLIDLRLTNPSSQQLLVSDAEAFLDEADGSSKTLEIFAESDAARMLDYYKTLGTKANIGLIRRDKINAGQTVDRTIAASAPMTEERVLSRKRFRFIVHDADGITAEVAETR